MRTFRHNVPWLLVGALCIAATVSGVLSCGSGDGEYSLLVRVQFAPPDTQSLSVYFTLDGKTAPGFDVTQKLDYFGVKLPSGTTGKLEVSVASLGSDQCKSASGKISIDLSAGRYQETAVSLSTLNPRLCSLYYQSTGEGELVIKPEGTSCGTGCMDHPAGTMVNASFNPSGSSFGAQLSLNAAAVCDGSSPCSFPLNRRAQLTANFNPRLCRSSKWCWYNPLPQGSVITSFGGTGPSDIWVTGWGGTILHYDGQAWSVSPSGTSNDLYAVWSLSPNEAWAVGDKGLILRWDGTRWTRQSSNTAANLQSVWGTSSTDVWAVGNNGVSVHYTGNAWATVPTGATQNLYRVTGSSVSNVWAVGPGGTVIKYDGSAWSSMPVTGQTTTIWNDAWVSATGEVWTVGTTMGGTCVNARFDGTSWMTGSGNSCGSSSIWGSSTADVWSAGGTLMSLARTSTSDVRTFNMQTLYSPAMYPGTISPVLNTIWGFGPGEVYVGTFEGNILKRNGDSRTTILTAPPSTRAAFIALAGNGTANDLFVVRQDGGVHRFDGRKLPTLPSTSGPSSAYDAWAAPAPLGDLFVGSQGGQLYRYSVSSNSWSMLTSPATATLYSTGGVSANEVYVGTSTGVMYRYDGTNFIRLNSTSFSGTIQAIWMRGTGDGWAVGDLGLTVRVTSINASTVANNAASGVSLFGVSGLPAPSQSVWVVGSGGYVGRFDGTTWRAVLSPTTADLSGVAAFGENDVWFAGVGGALLHWNGTEISAVPSGTTADLHKIWGNTTTGLWLAGSNGVLMRYQP